MRPRTKLLAAESGSDVGYFSGFTDHRGEFGPLNLSIKNIWGWDRIIILEDGYYDILLTFIASSSTVYPRLYINSTVMFPKGYMNTEVYPNGGKVMGKFNLKG